MEITKNKLIAAAVAAIVVIFGTASMQLPWIQKQWNDNVAPILSGVAPVSSN